MAWTVTFSAAFHDEFGDLPQAVRRQLLVSTVLLADQGPHLGRPHVDTLKGSSFVNMKEMRFGADDGVWRVAFAFDPQRRAVLLVAGEKSGVSQSRFYKPFIERADTRYRAHLKGIEEAQKETK